MALDLTLNGSPTPTPHAEGSLSLSASTTSISTLTGRVYGVKGVPQGGQEVGVYESAFRRFGGIINQVTRVRVGNGTVNDTQYDLICQGWEVRFLRHTIQAKVYTDKTAGQIFADLLDTKLASEGFTHGAIDDGLSAVDLGRYVIVGKTAAQVADDLANRCNFNWWVTADKVAFFMAKTTGTVGSLVLSPANKNYRTPRISETGEDYANVVKIQIGWDQIGATRHSFVGNSSAIIFTLPDVGGEPQLVDHVAAIFLNAVEQSVGIVGVDSGKQWYYEIGSKVITQNVLDPVLTAADTLDVDYFVLGRNIIVEEDATEITARAAIEGGSGRYEIFVDDSKNSDQIGAQNKALGLLDKLAPGRSGGTVGSWPKVYEFGIFSYEANTSELYPGNIITVNWTVPSTGGAKQVMVQSVDSSEMVGNVPGNVSRGYLLHNVKAVEHIPVGDHRAFLRALGGDNGSGIAIASGGSVDKYERFVFNIGIPVVGDAIANFCPKATAQRAQVRVKDWCLTGLVAPTGASFRLEILRNGVSIFGATKIVLTAGSIKARGTTFITSPVDIMYDDDLEVKVLGIGTTLAGSDFSLTLTCTVV